MKLRPEDFSYSIIGEARQIYLEAMNNAGRERLDSKTAIWIVTMDGWKNIRSEMELVMTVSLGPLGRKELMGIPVRVTVDDEPDVPMLQLVMEPKVNK